MPMPKMPRAVSVGLSLAIPVAIPVLLSASRALSAKDTIAILKRTKDVTLAVLEVVVAVTESQDIFAPLPSSTPG
ncbi:hypothetical protein N7449_005100 [Penicillium cf. viridicatum]|uniref:Uncharacterized protein n=1 Tax=Penicillium cf. viridicatum TaxID=2972119 RepID=A0A9W9MKG5_9EURO|nr:hypothetical protein N7449_005100 [Penicillium cf. viridicatum]